MIEEAVDNLLPDNKINEIQHGRNVGWDTLETKETITTLVGAALGKQDCWQRTACKVMLKY